MLQPVLGRPWPAEPPPTPPYWYTMYGRRVRSDFRLPIPPTAAGVEAPDWSFCQAPLGQRPPRPDGPVVDELRCHAVCHAGSVVGTVHRGPAGAWLWHLRVGTVHVDTASRRADVYLEKGRDERDLALLLAGPASIFILHQLGQPTLHASAVLTERGAVGFFGRKGQGKSTMVSYFLGRGAVLLTDDVLSLTARGDEIWAMPSLPIMKLWPDTVAHTLQLPEELPAVAPGIDKKLFRLGGSYQFARRPAQLSALYVLDRYDPATTGRTDVSTRQLRGPAAITALLSQVSYGAFLSPAEAARFLPLYARLAARTPVRVLSYPDGFDHRASVYGSILAELGKSGT